MRKIKFRAWHKSLCCFLGEDVSWYHYGPSLVDGEICSENCIIEQFTGVLDGNGKEIYEGDIVRGIMAAGSGMQSRPGKSCLFEVKTFMGGWGYETSLHQITKLTGDYRAYPRLERCEIIGNIHEFPELLN
jgi:uncharacterized phage protein (TIGR01671 family)